MPKRMSDSKYFKASMMIRLWVALLPDLTSTEAKRMLHQTYLNEDQIPSRSRVKSMIAEFLNQFNDEVTNKFGRLSARDLRAFEIARRKALLDVVARDTKLKGLRDNSDPLPYDEEVNRSKEK